MVEEPTGGVDGESSQSGASVVRQGRTSGTTTRGDAGSGGDLGRAEEPNIQGETAGVEVQGV